MKQVIILIVAITMSISNISAQSLDNSFFEKVNTFLEAEVNEGTINYSSAQHNAQLADLISIIENVDIEQADDKIKKAFYINAYNLLVINEAAKAYPIESVQDISGFFDRKKVRVAGKQMTLTKLEKDKLLKPYQDGRLHFVLVCGAVSCPPITNFAYTPELLDVQLDRQAKRALNDPTFIKVDGNNTDLSQIFKWYPEDFGKNKQGVIDFINSYRDKPISTSTKISYYPYNWSLNDTSSGSSQINPTGQLGNNAARYIVSSTIPKGSAEIKIFNNLYTQRTGSADNLTDRSTFFTTTVTALYGVSNKFNVGINTRYRRVRNDIASSSSFDVFSSGANSRQGITAFGPQIRYAPVEKWTNFSIQSSFVFPIGSELKGNGSQPFIDWNGATFTTQLFNDIAIDRNFSLFTELDFILEDIGNNANGAANRLSTPATLIFSYNPTSKLILYTLQGYSPFWQSTFDYFYQYGVGAKYQFTPNVELELLATDFTNKFLAETGGQASTLNIGFRFNL